MDLLHASYDEGAYCKPVMMWGRILCQYDVGCNVRQLCVDPVDVILVVAGV